MMERVEHSDIMFSSSSDFKVFSSPYEWIQAMGLKRVKPVRVIDCSVILVSKIVHALQVVVNIYATRKGETGEKFCNLTVKNEGISRSECSLCRYHTSTCVSKTFSLVP